MPYQAREYVSPSLSGMRPTPMLSRVSRLCYRVASPSAIGFVPCPLPRTASTETIGVGRTVRLSARPALHCVTLGLSGRTGPTTRGTRYRGITTNVEGVRKMFRTPEANASVTHGSRDCWADAQTRNSASVADRSVAFRITRTRGKMPTALPAWIRKRAVWHARAVLPFVKTSARLNQSRFCCFLSAPCPDAPSKPFFGPLWPARGGVASLTSPHRGVMSRTNSPAPRALLPRVTTSAIACVAPWGASPDEAGEPARLHTQTRCRRLCGG